MPKHKSPGKPRKKICPLCFTLSYNRCNYCTNKKCKFNFYIHKKYNKTKKNLITEFNIASDNSKYFKLMNYDKNALTNKLYNDTSFMWLKN